MKPHSSVQKSPDKNGSIGKIILLSPLKIQHFTLIKRFCIYKSKRSVLKKNKKFLFEEFFELAKLEKLIF